MDAKGPAPGKLELVRQFVNTHENPEREDFIETITRLGFVPVDDAAGVYGHFRALMERERFRKGKQ